MEILHFLNFKFEDLHKAKKPGFGLSLDPTRRASRAEKRRASRKVARQTQLIARRNIKEMDCLSPEPAKSSTEINKDKPEPASTRSASKTAASKSGSTKSAPVNKTPKPAKPANNRLELLKRWKAEKEAKLKREKATKKPKFVTGGAINLGFPSVNNTVEPSFAPKNAGFKAPKNIKPINMKLPALSRSFAKSNTNLSEKNTSKTTTVKPKPIVNVKSKAVPVKPQPVVNTTKVTAKPQPVVSTIKATNVKPKPVVNGKGTSIIKAEPKSVVNGKNTSIIKAESKSVANTSKINIKPTASKTNKKPVEVKPVPIKTTVSNFLRVTRSQKPVASPPLPLPSKKPGVPAKKIEKANETLSSKFRAQSKKDAEAKKIDNQSEKSKVKFQENNKTPTEDKGKVTYKKTPKLVRQAEPDLDDSVEHVVESVSEEDTKAKKTPRRRKSLRSKKISETLDNENELSNMLNAENILSLPEKSPNLKENRRNSIKRKSVENKENSETEADPIQIIITSEKTHTRKKVRRSVHSNVLKEVNTEAEENETHSENENSKRRTRKNVHTISEDECEPIVEPNVKVKKNRKSVHNFQNSENEETKTKSPAARKTRKSMHNSSILNKSDGSINGTKTPKRNTRTNNKLTVKSSENTLRTPEVNKSKNNSSTMSNSCSENLNSSLSDSVFQTPENKAVPTVYISPFVTTSRGKGSTKKENKARQSLGFAPFTESSPEQNNQAGAAYFHNVLDNVIERLLAECKIWEEYKASETVSDDACDMIDVAVGQAHLLINKKFQQFRNLINNCQNGDAEKPVTCVDLEGFWDMIYIQVDNLDIRFKRLADMKANNWEEIQPVVKKKVLVKKRAPVKSKSTTTAARSNIRDAIKAARLKSVIDNKEPKNNLTVFNGGFFVVKSPNKATPNPKTPSKSKRKSLLASVLSTEAKKKSIQNCYSPGLTTLRLSQTFKSVGKERKDLNQTLPTPGKSILKKSSSLKPHNISKVVLFKDEDEESE